MREDLPLTFEQVGEVGCIRLQRPRQLNAINPAMVSALEAALAGAEEARCRALLITGSGRAFCAGADLAELPGVGGAAPNPSTLREFLLRMKAACDRLEAFPAPTVAVVNGLACAGGLELVLCCDIVVASPEARLGDMHANYGLLPGAGASLRLPQRIGLGAARLLMYSGESWSAEEFHRLGLVQRLFSAQELEPEAFALAAALAAKSPLAARRTKELLAAGAALPREDALFQEIERLAAHSASSDMREGLLAFTEKRPPAFTGH